MEGNEVEKAAEEYTEGLCKIPLTANLKRWSMTDFIAGANWQKEKETAPEYYAIRLDAMKKENKWLDEELTRALARIDELTTQNLDLIRKYDDLYKIAYGMVGRATGPKDSYLNEEI